jgi:hypothetical protein
MKSLWFVIGAALLLAGALLLPTGCENESDVAGESFTIQPAHTVLWSNQTVALRAIGGIGPFQWQVSDTELGTIGGGSNDTVNYRRTALRGLNQVSVRDSRSWVATATINQR